ncbi:hypothetical protein HMN09_01165700 [Mycena chlorophos]|uniref:Uncharacterized protein n=1 Tax=Mycena chlorophos TaxID=658473 RepID=A0A8H6S7L8_MYCCL|nr:hypothetical protein HMN09_01165700 [Mycena chlorophos]
MAITCVALVSTNLLDDDSQTLSKTRSLLHCVLLALKDDEKLLNQIGLVLTQIWFTRNTAGVDAEDLPRNGGSFTQAEILGAIERVGKRSGIQVAKGLMKDGERAWACVSKVQGDSVGAVGGASGLRGLVLNWDMVEAYEGEMDEVGALVVVSFIRELMCMLHDELFPAQRDMEAPPLPRCCRRRFGLGTGEAGVSREHWSILD